MKLKKNKLFNSEPCDNGVLTGGKFCLALITSLFDDISI